jgi:hypothetical protein
VEVGVGAAGAGGDAGVHCQSGFACIVLSVDYSLEGRRGGVEDSGL